MKKNKLALFDLDDTLFDGDTEAEWVKYMDHRGFIQDFDFYSKMEAFEKNYREGRLDVDEYSEFLLSPIIGKSLKELEDHIEDFTSDIVTRFSDELSQELLDKHKNDTKVLTSGSLSFLVHKIGTKLGIDNCFGTDPEYLEGKFTGRVEGKPNFSQEKVRRVNKWMGSKKFDQIFSYSDSIHDLPLLEFADFPMAISPDKELRRVAKEREWLIDDRRSS
ncbi:MAG: HAD-IB family hydrolase [Gammaproteobacteria bacterium]